MGWDSVGTVVIGSKRDVPRLGFGGAWLTGPGTFGPPPDPDAARSAVRLAWERGVRLFDTADCYGPEISETLICESLHPYPEGVVVSSKGGRLARGNNQWDADGRPEHLRAACEGSLRRLRLDRIDLYQLNEIDSKVPLEESLGALVELQHEGKIGAVGLCNVTVDELERARAVTPIASVQDRFDLLTREHHDVLGYCTDHGIVFLPWFPPLNDLRAEPASVLGAIASAHGTTPGSIALAWMLRAAPVTVPLPGTWNPTWEEENLAVVDLDLTADQMRELDGLAPRG
ncbi:MAG TPA: aldo/keto reductase [Acidimicrobiia bacterium]|nr:aldo/keto reductase [Acidimicrobiia bacterium]